MPRAGRPPLTEEILQQRVADYCARYGVRDRNSEGFPVYPAGRRETLQHREWVVLFKAHSRVRARASAGPETQPADGACPICLQPPGAGGHPRCEAVIAVVRELGPPALDRIRQAAFGP